MTTWNELFGLVLRDSGVAAAGQTPSAQMSQDTKMRLNFMLAQWRRRRWLVYHLIDISAPCDGSLFYTLGTGQTFNVPRTDQIEAAYVRQINTPEPNRVDYPLKLITSREDYSQITLKNLTAGPAWFIWYNAAYPVAEVYIWPLASNQWELHLIIKAELDSVVNLTDTIVLPDEYQFALYWNLIQLTRSAYELPPKPEVDRQARASLETLRAANAQISRLSMPAAVRPMTGGSAYNVVSDSWGPRRG